MLAIHIAIGIVAGFLILDFLRSASARQKALFYLKVILKPFIFIYKVLKSFLIDFVKLWWHWLIAAIPTFIIIGIGSYLNYIFKQEWIWSVTITLAGICMVGLYCYTTRND